MSKEGLIIILLVLGVWIWFLRRQIRTLQRLNEVRTKEREAVISFLHKIGERITQSMEFQGSLEIITNFIVEYTNAESGAIFLLNEEDQTLRANVVLGLFPPLHKTTTRVYTKRKYLTDMILRDKIKLGEGIIGLVAQTGECQLISDATKDPRVPESSTDYITIESIMVAPLRVKDKVLGVMAVVNKRDGQVFNSRDMSLLESLSDQAAVTVDIFQLYERLAKQNRIENEIQLARDFQRLLLPSKCPEIPGIEMAAFSEPALEVGGDYYDFIWIDDEHLGIAIADVSGKGIPGALVMAMVRSILRAESRNNLSPASVLKIVNEYIRQDTKPSVFITMTYAVINIKTNVIRFARAGHEPLIRYNSKKGGEPDLYTPNGIALGLVMEDIFNITEDLEIPLAEGDLVVLYTDGVIEAMNNVSEEYTRNRLLKTIRSSADGGVQDVLDAIMNDIRLFTRDIPQHDDITMIALEILSSRKKPGLVDGSTAESTLSNV